VPKEGNIYDLIEREAARSRIPRIELWQSVAKALVEKRLEALRLPVQFSWLVGFKAAVDRHNDPNICARILKHIIVRVSDFEKWLRGGKKSTKRGPVRGATGLQALDRKLFSQISKRIKTGKARSAHHAALQLFDEDKVSGNSRKSTAKRVSGRYLKEYAT
jgi:hypothetical protein